MPLKKGEGETKIPLNSFSFEKIKCRKAKHEQPVRRNGNVHNKLKADVWKGGDQRTRAFMLSPQQHANNVLNYRFFQLLDPLAANSSTPKSLLSREKLKQI